MHDCCQTFAIRVTFFNLSSPVGHSGLEVTPKDSREGLVLSRDEKFVGEKFLARNLSHFSLVLYDVFSDKMESFIKNYEAVWRALEHSVACGAL